MSYAIGIDLGGTNIKIISVSNSGETLWQESRPTQDSKGIKQSIPAWAAEIREMLAKCEEQMGQKAQHIGLSAPGLADEAGRTIAFMPGRLHGLEGFNWSEFLQQDVYVTDDAKAALLGEVWQGAARGYTDVIMITLGTGVGGAIYAGGQLIKGHVGRAGNLGHISLNTEGPLDVAGMPGSFEYSIGNASIKERSNGKYSSTKELADAAKAGDSAALKIWNLSVYKLSCALAGLVNVLDPEAIVIGGGIANAGPFLFDAVEANLHKLEWRPNGHKVKVLPAKLSEWAGAIGSACYAIRSSQSSYSMSQ